MRLGFGLPVGGTGATPDNVSVLARHAEALGYRSLWVFQRLLCPVAPLNSYYGAPNEAWPEPFRSTLDPIVTLAFIAAQTERVRLGTSVLVAPFYSPVVLGKQLATLDVISRGRLTVGLGIGWSRDEYDAAGTPWEQRGARIDEFIECLDALWTQDEVKFKGAFYFVPTSRVEPKPVQKPRPPLLIGGYSEAAFRRAGRLGDGYTGGNMAPEKLAHTIARVREHAERAVAACAEEPNPFEESRAVMIRGWALATEGQMQEGLARIVQGDVHAPGTQPDRVLGIAPGHSR